MLRIPPRGRHITQEPQTIANHLLGRSLASFRRRLAAFVLDTLLFGIVTGALFLGLTAWSFHRDDPTLFARLKQAAGATDVEVTDQAQDQLLADFHYLILKRCPEAYPRAMATHIRDRNLPALHDYFSTFNTTIGLGNGSTRTIEGTDGTNKMVIGMDLLMGRFAGVLGWSGLFVAWFTIWPRITGGRSPGKALLRIRVVRLDGGSLRWWDCFGRAAGYGASAATLFLGFLEAIWHPNRQAIHDKIAGTVVVRG
jgi:uncharacterized RDD family membrane protein YckC